LFNEKFN